jgi:hypothetical protein
MEQLTAKAKDKGKLLGGDKGNITSIGKGVWNFKGSAG